VPRYLIERCFDVGQEQMNAVGRRSRQIAEERYPSITWEHSHVVLSEDGRVQTFCVYSAPDEDQLRSHAEELGDHTVLQIAEIVGDVTPDDFPH
jgi:Protein of unknown function (DUF4242)